MSGLSKAAAAMGRKGGQSRSKAKLEAVAKNAQKAGRHALLVRPRLRIRKWGSMDSTRFLSIEEILIHDGQLQLSDYVAEPKAKTLEDTLRKYVAERTIPTRTFRGGIVRLDTRGLGLRLKIEYGDRFNDPTDPNAEDFDGCRSVSIWLGDES